MATPTTSSTFQRTSTIRLTPTPNRQTPKSLPKPPFLSLQHRRPKPLCLSSSSSSSSFSPTPSSSTRARTHSGFFFRSASSQDETLVTEDEKQVDIPESQAQEDTEGTVAVNNGSSQGDGTGAEESPPSIFASLQSYKEALANNDESKIAEIETHFKVVEDETLDLQRKLATLSDELSNAKDRMLRISADFDNFRKRTEREHLSLVTNAQGEVIERLLPVLDNFERAKAQIKLETEKEEKINNSYQSIYKQFVEILGSLGVLPVETIAKPFDPLLHEAIMREESTEYDEGVILEEYRKGFVVGDRLLRPAMVKVSAGPGPEKPVPVTPSEPEDIVMQEQAVPLESSEGAKGSEEDQSEPAPTQDE